jgi:hypothetical protein
MLTIKKLLEQLLDLGDKGRASNQEDIINVILI